MKFKHLEELGLSYLEHATFALKVSFHLFLASMALVMHAIFPDWFVHYASDTVVEIAQSFKKHIDHSRILVHFNTKWKEDPEGRQWRVLIDGVEDLAHSVRIKTDILTVEEPIAGEQKFHFLCYGKVEWDDNYNATILG